MLLRPYWFSRGGDLHAFLKPGTPSCRKATRTAGNYQGPQGIGHSFKHRNQTKAQHSSL